MVDFENAKKPAHFAQKNYHGRLRDINAKSSNTDISEHYASTISISRYNGTFAISKILE